MSGVLLQYLFCQEVLDTVAQRLVILYVRN
jgi:hypothetical protein